MGGLARAYLSRGAGALPAAGAAALLARLCPGHPDQRPAGPDVRRPRRRWFCPIRSARHAGSSTLRPWLGAALHARRRAALVRRHRAQEPAARSIAAVRRPGHAGQGRHGPEVHWAPPGFYLLSPSSPPSGPAPSWRPSPCLSPGSTAGRSRWPSCSPGSCRPGSCSRRCRPSCRITRCRSIRRLRS